MIADILHRVKTDLMYVVEATLNGKPGKWRTVLGKRIFLEKGREFETIKKRLNEVRSKKKKERDTRIRKEGPKIHVGDSAKRYYSKTVDLLTKTVEGLDPKYTTGIDNIYFRETDAFGEGARGAYSRDNNNLYVIPSSETGTYLVGVLYHELGHHSWLYSTQKQRDEWESEVRRIYHEIGPLTEYSGRYESHVYKKGAGGNWAVEDRDKAINELIEKLEEGDAEEIRWAEKYLHEQQDWVKLKEVSSKYSPTLFGEETFCDFFSIMNGNERWHTDKKVLEKLKPIYRRIFGDDHLSKTLKEAAVMIAALQRQVTELRIAAKQKGNGRWVTIRGTAVFIPEGKNQEDVIAEKIKEWDKKDTEKKSQHTIIRNIDPEIRKTRPKGTAYAEKLLAEMPDNIWEGLKEFELTDRKHSKYEFAAGWYSSAAKSITLKMDSVLTKPVKTTKDLKKIKRIMYHEAGHHVWHKYRDEQHEEWQGIVEDFADKGMFITDYALWWSFEGKKEADKVRDRMNRLQESRKEYEKELKTKREIIERARKEGR